MSDELKAAEASRAQRVALELREPSARIFACELARTGSDGLLEILGAGWTVMRVGAGPVTTAVALVVTIPWEHTNRQLKVRLELLDEDGGPALTDAGDEVFSEFNVNAGRPGGGGGRVQHVPVPITFAALALEPGVYRWHLSLEGRPAASYRFRVISATDRPG